MTNSWSLLYEELKMGENFEDRYEDKLNNTYDFWTFDENSMVGNPIPGASSPDTITFSGDIHAAAEVPMTTLFGAVGEDSLSFDLKIPDLPTTDNNNGRWKYNEDVILKEVRDYLGGTYRSHYASPESKTQTLDLIESVGDAEPFCRSNALKYLSRFGKKDGKSKQDILKAIHYCILLYHFAGLCNENTQPYETF